MALKVSRTFSRVHVVLTAWPMMAINDTLLNSQFPEISGQCKWVVMNCSINSS